MICFKARALQMCIVALSPSITFTAQLEAKAGNIYVSSIAPYSRTSSGSNLTNDLRAGDRFVVRVGDGWSNNNFSFPYRIKYDGNIVRTGSISVFGNFGFGSFYSSPIVATQGVHTIEAEVDYLNQIGEDNEADNTISATFTVGPPTTPMVQSIALTSPSTGVLQATNLNIGVSTTLLQNENLLNGGGWTTNKVFTPYTRMVVEPLAITNTATKLYFRTRSNP